MNQELYNQSHDTYLSVSQTFSELTENVSDIYKIIYSLKVQRNNFIEFKKSMLNKEEVNFVVDDAYIKNLIESNSIYAKEYFENKIEMIESEIYFYTQQQIKYLSEFYSGINYLLY